MKKYNFDEMIDCSGMNSMKHELGHHINPYLPEEFIAMSVADMDFACPAPIIDAIKERLDRRILGYCSYGDFLDDSYYNAIIHWLKRRHDIEAKKENIVFSASIIASCYQAIKSMTKIGEGVMIHIPEYPGICEPIKALNRKQVLLPLQKKDDSFFIDFEQLEEEAKKPENTLLILCSPHNPCGRVWTREELLRLAGICFSNHVRIFVDGIHNDLTRKNVNMVALAALFPNDSRIVTALSISKSFNCAGNQHSYVLLYDEVLKKAFEESMYCGNPNPLSVAAVIAAYDHCEEWLEALKVYVDGNFKYLKDFVDKLLPRAKFEIPEGTYLAWIDLSGYGLSEAELYKRLSESGLDLKYESEFLGEGEGCVRMNVACPRSVLEKACSIMQKVLERE